MRITAARGVLAALALILLAALAALVAVSAFRRTPVATDPPPATGDARGAGAAESGIHQANALPAIPRFIDDAATLPANGTPLALQFDALHAAADGGSALAACRLFVAATRCRYVRAIYDIRRFPGRIVDGLLPDDPAMDATVSGLLERRTAELPSFLQDGARALTVAKMDTSLIHAIAGPTDEDRAFCKDAPEHSDDELRRLLRQAALGGEPTSMRLYATGAFWLTAPLPERNASGTSPALLDTPEFQAWVAEAPLVLQAAIERGDREALLIALRAARGHGPLAPALPADPRRDAILGVVALRLEGRTPVPSTAELGLPPTQAKDADREAAALYLRAFARHRDGLWATVAGPSGGPTPRFQECGK